MADSDERLRSLGENPYGGSPALTILRQLFNNAHPDALAFVTESYLERLTLLEMYIEEETDLEIGAEQLEDFLARRHPEVKEETAKMANLFYGKIASREG